MNLVNNEEEEDIAQIINTLRDRLNHADNYRNRGELDKKLEQIGFQNNHEFKHALTTRFFRTNSNADLDNVLKSMYFKWKDFEEKLDIEIDLRVIAFILSNRNENKIEEVLSEVDTPTDRNMIIAWRMGVIYGLLWGRGRIIRNNHLNVYNPYLQDLELQNKALERILFSNFLNTYFNRISIEESDFVHLVEKGLSENKVITIFSTLSKQDLIAECLIKILENKIMSGEIGVYPRILEVRKSTTEIEVDLELIEAKNYE